MRQFHLGHLMITVYTDNAVTIYSKKSRFLRGTLDFRIPWFLRRLIGADPSL